MTVSWSFDAIDAKHKPKKIALECTRPNCGSIENVQPRAINGEDMVLCADCYFEMTTGLL